jgi:hypothetical protein
MLQRRRAGNAHRSFGWQTNLRGCNSMAEGFGATEVTWVRFPPSAPPAFAKASAGKAFARADARRLVRVALAKAEARRAKAGRMNARKANLVKAPRRKRGEVGSKPTPSTNLRASFGWQANFIPGWRNRQTHLTVNQAPKGLQVRALLQEPTRCRRLAARTPVPQTGNRGFESRRQHHLHP